MKKLLMCAFIVSAFLGLLFSAVPGNAAAAEQDISKARCLMCHGPYEKLASKPPVFKGFDPGQSKITAVNPHQYWPHEDKTEKGIQECTFCHKPHKENMKPGDKVERADVEKCFGCHHDRTFERCKTCHEH